jgi:hypothetical protein
VRGGLGSGSGWVAVAGVDGGWQCGHFDTKHDGVWMNSGSVVVAVAVWIV